MAALTLLLLAVVAWLSKPGVITRLPTAFRHSLPAQDRQYRRHLDSIESLVVQRGLAAILMLAFVVINMQPYPAWGDWNSAAGWVIAIIVLLVPILAYLIVRSDMNDAQRLLYNGLKDLNWSVMLIYFISTCLYMALYEILLRGISLEYLTENFAVAIAVALNTLVYAAMHLVKNHREALLCIPLGILLCWLTLFTHSVWPAVVFHSVMALSFEVFYSRKQA